MDHTVNTMKRPVRSAAGWGVAILGAMLLNIALFGLMPGLIQGVPQKPENLDEIRPTRVVRMKKPDTPVRRKTPPEVTKPSPPEKQVTAPEQITRMDTPKPRIMPKLKFELNPRLPAAKTDLVMPSLAHFDVPVQAPKTSYNVMELDTGLTPLVKIPPMYPARAKRRGIEGFVTVTFTVTDSGTVTDIQIVDARPEKVFDTAVRNCISRWKFKVPTVDGVPVSANAKTTIKFQLEE